MLHGRGCVKGAVMEPPFAYNQQRCAASQDEARSASPFRRTSAAREELITILISDAILTVDSLKPNSYTLDQKLSWLSKLDGQIYEEVFKTHEVFPDGAFVPYDGENIDEPLLVPYPFDADIYINFLEAQIDRENGETAKYNQSITLFNNAYQNFTSWYNRTHTPRPTGQRFIF